MRVGDTVFIPEDGLRGIITGEGDEGWFYVVDEECYGNWWPDSELEVVEEGEE